MISKACKKCGGSSFRKQIQKKTLLNGDKVEYEFAICRDCAISYNRTFYGEKKKQVFDHYGWECSCCGEAEQAFLSVDHINNDGHAEVWESNGKRIAGIQLYARIVRNKFPEKYQTLCMNCNFGKRMNDGVCPHNVIISI